MHLHKTILKRVAGGVLVIFAAMQLFNPSHENPPVTVDFIASAHPPTSVAAALRAACYDCHSHETVWPLYSRIAPVSWLIASDVTEGRKHLNFSTWSAEPARAAKNLDRINEVIDYHEMPPAKYTLLHSAARLTESQRREVLDWTESAAGQMRTNASPDAPH